jgi:hypothetical protein
MVSPSFGPLLARLMVYRGLAVSSLSQAAAVSAGELQALVTGEAPPNPSVLMKLAPSLGLHTADLFVIAGLAVPGELAPADLTAGQLIGSLVWDAIRLPADQRARLRHFSMSLPQEPRTPKEPLPSMVKQDGAGFGAMLVRMLCDNRNLRNWRDAAVYLACLTDGRMYVSPSTIAMIGHGQSALTPEWLVGFATALGIPISSLTAITGIEVPPGDTREDAAAADVAELVWDARRLTRTQLQDVCVQARSMSAEISDEAANRAFIRARKPGSA